MTVTYRYTRAIALLTLAVVATIIALVGVETYLRHVETHVTLDHADRVRAAAALEHDAGLLVQYTRRGRRLVPNARVVIRNHYLSRIDVPMRINALGFRGPDIASEPPPATVRILVLGDSITWGDFAREEDTFVHQLGIHLNAGGGVPKAEVVNAGIGDVGLREEIDLLVDRGLAAKPNVVVLALYMNDGRPAWGFPGELGERGWLRRHSVLAETIYRNLALLGWTQERGISRVAWIPQLEEYDWRNSREEFLRLARTARYDWGDAWRPETWKAIAEELRRLADLARSHRFEVAVVVFPVSYQVYAAFEENFPQQRACELSAELRVPCLDLLPLLRANRNPNLFYDQCHPTPATSRLISAEIARFLRERQLVPRPDASGA